MATLTCVNFRCSAAIFILLLKLNETVMADCNLEKIFRTPKDMARVNFDHFEIVERGDYETREPATTRPPTNRNEENTDRKTSGNVANAQIMLRFGNDDLYGTNHIMKIPPQCRNIANHQFDSYYPRYGPGPDRPQFYHPYPPPVPYLFPNYYFCNYYGPERAPVPAQLGEYFRRHPEFFQENQHQVFIRGRPMKWKDVENAIRVVNVKSPGILNEKSPPENATTKIIQARPMIVKMVNLRNGDRQKIITRNGKVAEKNEENEIKQVLTKTAKKYKKCQKQNRREQEYMKKLLSFYKCQNDTELIHPMASDNYCPCGNAAKTNENNFPNDIDGLITITIALDPETSAAKLTGISLDVAKAPSRVNPGLPTVVTKLDLPQTLATPNNCPPTYYFFPQPDVSVRTPLPNYLKVVENSLTADSHNNNNNNKYSCIRESKQLNEW